MKDFLLVGLGGFLGSIGRYAVYLCISKYNADRSFLATLTVNLIGCFLIGLLSGGLVKSNSQLGLLLIAGICGGFTTFSTFGMDGMRMLREGVFLDFFLYVSASLVGGLILCFAGFYVAQKM